MGASSTLPSVWTILVKILSRLSGIQGDVSQHLSTFICFLLFMTTPLCSRWLRSAHFQSWARLLGPKLIMKRISALQRLRLENACILIQCLSFLATHATNFLISVMKVLTKTCNWTCKFQFWVSHSDLGFLFRRKLGAKRSILGFWLELGFLSPGLFGGKL